MVKINLNTQILQVFKNHKLTNQYLISSAKKGTGNRQGSLQTPLGLHKIKLKIGKDCPFNSVFVARRATGEIYHPNLAKLHPNRDWILSRILWLQGLEIGVNRGVKIDSLKRFIYIHGTPDTEPMGVANSHGCIRMRNNDIIELFNKTAVNTLVTITNE